MNTTLEKLTQPLASAVIILVVLFLFGKFGPGLPLSVNQITTNKDQPFMVTGDGKVTAKPDTAQVNFGVESSGTTVVQTQSKSNSTLNNIVAKIKNLGINESDIKTTNYNIYPQYSDQFAVTTNSVQMPSQGITEKMITPPDVPVNPQQPKIIGYKVSINITVTVHDLSKVNQVVDTATANGASQVDGISFIVDKPEQYQSQARKLAIADAKKKANELAGEAGLTLGKVVGVAESPSYFPRPYALSAKMESDVSGNSQTQLNPGSTEISTQVTLSFETR